MNGQETPPSPQWHRLFIGICGVLLLFLLLLAWMIHGARDNRNDWFEEAKRYANQHPENLLMGSLVEAFRKTDWDALENSRDDLRRVAVQGWGDGAPEITALLEQHEAAIAAVERAAEAPEAPFPTTENSPLLSPRPNIPALNDFTFLLVADARQSALDGNPQLALQKLLNVAILGSRFTRPSAEASLSSQIVGMAAIEVATNAMTPIMDDTGLTSRDIARHGAGLLSVEHAYRSVGEALAAEAEFFSAEVTDRIEDPSKLRILLQYYGHELTEAAAQSLAAPYADSPEALARDQKQLWGDILTMVTLPSAAQPRIDRDWFEERARHPLLAYQFTDVSTLIVRERVLLSKLRLARWRCGLLSGAAGSNIPPADPFAMDDLLRAGDRLYSVGPDTIDGGGLAEYNPAKGVWSGGDVIIPLGALDP